ncbi:MAG: L,D-transpeptidase family protein [Desulfobacteraceae bacterium]|nr:L,D-transpeptidase family protein [Desulfobacteraceae bacterium]MDH3872884.1 L,D-transpeptidase family protein [Desulfobacteraceae bacterium]
MIKTIHIKKICCFMLSIVLIIGTQKAIADSFSYSNNKTVVGSMKHHIVVPKETLLDIVRNFGLGYNELSLLYPKMDPWIPSPGQNLVIPTQWILPSTKLYGLVINLPELRLYHFNPKTGMVTTYPVGIGDIGWETPVAVGHVIHRKVDPTWLIPESLREKYGAVTIPPGPNNPLGKYWIGLSLTGYGIHGTNSPWGIGKLVSHGCIRLYPEHIALLFEKVYVNTPVEIVYETVKIGIQDQNIFMEVHPDIYHKIPDMQEQALRRLHELDILSSISVSLVKDTLEKQSGLPVRVGFLTKGGDDTLAVKASD